MPLWANADDVVIMFSFSGDVSTRYSVPRTVAKNLPRWESTKQAVPLSQESAVQITEKYLRKIHPEIKQWVPLRIALSSSLRSDKDYIWYYSITLQQSATNAKGMEKTVIVLLDGSIVEPVRLPKRVR